MNERTLRDAFLITEVDPMQVCFRSAFGRLVEVRDLSTGLMIALVGGDPLPQMPPVPRPYARFRRRRYERTYGSEGSTLPTP